MSEAVVKLQEELGTSFYDAYIENLENFLDGQQARVIEGVPNQETVAYLNERYQELSQLSLSSEEKRKVEQLLLLQGIRKEPVQANHQLTPDSLGYLFVYMIESLMHSQKDIRIADLMVGTGNLLATVLANLETPEGGLKGYGVDVDETLLSISAVNQEWLDLDVQLFHQDSLQPLLMDPVDVAIGDLPIGYYPHDERVKEFKVSVAEGHTYAHHLLLEQSMKYVRDSGYGVFLMPTNFLETEQAGQIKTWLMSDVYLQAIVKLPDALFSQKSLSKSIVIFQNHGANAEQAKEIFVADLVSMKDNDIVLNFIKEFKSWREANIK